MGNRDAHHLKTDLASMRTMRTMSRGDFRPGLEPQALFDHRIRHRGSELTKFRQRDAAIYTVQIIV
jgi:hypothetical protein